MQRKFSEFFSHTNAPLSSPQKSKKRRKHSNQYGHITPALKKTIFEMHYGPNVNQGTCLLCGIAKVYKSRNSGFEAAHIVSAGYYIGKLNRYAVVPSCASCNNECDAYCIFDFLYARHRYAALKRIAWTLWCCYKEENPEECAKYDHIMFRFMYDFFGKERYKAGGGISSERAVYDLFRQHQVDMETKELARLSEEMGRKSQQLQHLLEARFDKYGML